MKKLLIVASLCAISSFAQAQTVACAGNAGPGTPVTAGVAGTAFILTGFTPRCSANVFLQWSQSARAVGVGAASSKGGVAFTGNSEGGGVAGNACGTNRRCAGAAEAAAAATAGLAAASS